MASERPTGPPVPEGPLTSPVYDAPVSPAAQAERPLTSPLTDRAPTSPLGPMPAPPSVYIEDMRDRVTDQPQTRQRPLSSVEGHQDPFRSPEGSLNASRVIAGPSSSPMSPGHVRVSGSTVENRFDDHDPLSPLQDLSRYGGTGLGVNQPLPPLPVRLGEQVQRPSVRRQLTTDTRFSGGHRSAALDWLVPLDEKHPDHSRTIFARIAPTIAEAEKERIKYAAKAKFHGYALNVAIGLQVLFGSLTTGLSAVATSGRSAAIQTTILGGLSTIVASYLAKARGSREPELSEMRKKDLEQFLREAKAFQMDHGNVTSDEKDEQLRAFRTRFEELLGNVNGPAAERQNPDNSVVSKV